MLIRSISILAVCLLTGGDMLAQGQGPLKPDTAIVNFFVGHWKGAGRFGSGAPISATENFHLTLDSVWLVCDHADVPPMNYKGTSYWGMDGNTKQFTAYIFDNYNGHRVFASRGFVNGKIVLSSQNFAPSIGTYFEHFIYEKLGPTQYQVTYETSVDGISWHLGDKLVFNKTD